MTPTIVNFTKPSAEPTRAPELPQGEVLDELLLGKPMKSNIVVTINEDGALSYWVDHLSVHECVGVLESVKLSLLAGDLDD